MNVEIGKANYPETPASAIADEIVEHVAALMMLCGGIEGISATKYTCGFGSELNVQIAHFADVPDAISAQGVIIKDALAKILSVANITRVVAKPSDDELKQVKDSWEKAALDARRSNEGSAQDFSESAEA